MFQRFCSTPIYTTVLQELMVLVSISSLISANLSNYNTHYPLCTLFKHSSLGMSFLSYFHLPLVLPGVPSMMTWSPTTAFWSIRASRRCVILIRSTETEISHWKMTRVGVIFHRIVRVFWQRFLIVSWFLSFFLDPVIYIGVVAIGILF